ncbi:MAG TPA: hypothetical protein DER23_03805, partial [Clostridiales bacterium]|nr:hypothetical protein [Clostridiales bacterium]
MKKMKRSFSLVLVLALLFSLLPNGLPAVSEQTQDNTVYLNVFYAGGDSDGSVSKPFTTLSAAINALESKPLEQGYIYLQTDYTHRISTDITTVDFTQAHGVHIVYTSNPQQVKNLNVVIHSTNTLTTWANKHFGANVHLVFHGPVTFDYVNVFFTPDPNNPLTFAVDTTQTVPLTEGGTASYTFPADSPFYANYTFTAVSGSVAATPVPAAGESSVRQYFRNIGYLRYVINGTYFEVKPHASFTVDTTVDSSRSSHVIPTSYKRNVNDLYTHPSGLVTLRAGTWGNLYPYRLSGYEAAPGTTITVGGTATGIFRGPYSVLSKSGTIRYYYEGGVGNTTIADVFGNIIAKKTAPHQRMDVEIIPDSPSLTFVTSSTYPMLSAYTPGCGTYTLHIRGNNFNTGYLLAGYKTLKLSQNTALTVSASAFPSIGFDDFIIEEGSVLTLGGTMSRTLTLSVTPRGDHMENTSFVVMNVDPDTYAKLSLNANSGMGSLRYDATTGNVWFDSSYGYVTYVINDTESQATTPVNNKVYASGHTMALEDPGVTVLSDGRTFVGWRNTVSGVLYKRGSYYTVTVGENVLEAVWSSGVAYTSGYATVAPPVSVSKAEGETMVLADLRGSTVIDTNGNLLSFFGWMDGTTTYYAGDEYTLGAYTSYLKALWAITVCVNSSYAGGDSDGSYEKPYTSLNAAYPVLQTKLSGNAYQAGSILFIGSQTVDLDDNTNSIYTYQSNSKYTNYSANLAAAGKPVLFAADTSSSVITYSSPSYVFYIAFNNTVMFDNMTMKLNTLTTSRIYTLSGDMTFGASFNTYENSLSNKNKNRGLGIDYSLNKCASYTVRLYGGDFYFVYLGSSSSARNHFLYAGNGTSTPILNLICMNNTDVRNNSVGVIRSGTVNHLSFSYAGTEKFVTGSMDITIKGGQIIKISDAYSSYSTVEHLADCGRYLTFDGFTGSVLFTHTNIGTVPGLPGNYANGLDRISLINGTSLTLSTNNVYIKADPMGTLYVDETSSFTSKTFYGIQNDFSSGEVSIPLNLPVKQGILLGFDGINWIYSYTLDSGSLLPIGPIYTYEANTTVKLPKCNLLLTGLHGNPDLAFYAWADKDGTFYYENDTVTVTERLTLTAVWAAVMSIDPTYGGGDSNGTAAKPYTSFNNAYLAMDSLLDTFSCKAAAFRFVGNQVWNLDDNTGSIYTYSSNQTYTDYQAKLMNLGVPVLYTANSDSTVVTLTSPGSVFYLAYNSDTMFDNITIEANTRKETRFMLGNYDYIFGTDFTFLTTYRTIGVDFSSTTKKNTTVRLYGGNFAFVYLGSSTSTRTCNLIIGDGISTPAVTNLTLGNLGAKNDNDVTIHSGTITNLIFAYIGTAQNVSANMTVTVKGGTIGYIKDYYFAYSTYGHMINSIRSLIFDGYTGQFTYQHLNIGTAAGVYGDYANGLDNVYCINGSSVKILSSPIYLKANPEGHVYFDLTSSLQAGSQGFVGIGSDFNSGETTFSMTYSFMEGLTQNWNGTAWNLSLDMELGSAMVRDSTRFAYPSVIADLSGYSDATVSQRGILVLPISLYSGTLILSTNGALKVVASVPVFPNAPYVVNGYLDNAAYPTVDAWLQVWGNQDVYVCAYFTLSDGTTVYSPVASNTQQAIWGILENPQALDANDTYTFTAIPVKNEVDTIPLNTRTYYPNEYQFLTRLETIKGALGTILTTPTTINSELQTVMGMALDLDIYADYYNHTYYEDSTGNTYGAVPAAKRPIGGGEGYPYAFAGRYIGTATDDNSLKSLLDIAQYGDVIVISGEIVIDLADFMLAGNEVGFTGKKIPYEFVIPAGVTLLGSRGMGGQSGAILKTTSYVDVMLTLEAEARLSGLVLQGAESYGDEGGESYNHSIGIKAEGDGAIIDNCEISGFYHTGVLVENASGVVMQNNYFHHIAGKSSGNAIKINHADVNVTGNLFANVNRILSMSGSDSDVIFTGNVETSNEKTTLFVLASDGGYDGEYVSSAKSISSLKVVGNTFLSAANPFFFQGIPSSMTVTNNLFAYQESKYAVERFIPMTADASVFQNRYILQNNVFDIITPKVISKEYDAPAKPGEAFITMNSVMKDIAITPFTIPSKPKTVINYPAIADLTVLSASYYRDNDDRGYALLLETMASVGTAPMNDIQAAVQSAIDIIGGYSNYSIYLNKNQISMEIDGIIYGAYSDGDPLGGGKQYRDAFTTGNYVATNADELYAAAAAAGFGDVIFIPGGTIIELGNAQSGTLTSLLLKAGVTLASDRGKVNANGTVSIGAIIKTSYNTTKEMITIGGDNVRITGIVVHGADPGRHLAHWDRCFASTGPKLDYSYFYKLPVTKGIHCVYNNLEVDNCEFSGFSYAAIYLSGQGGAATTGHKIHHNYIHHNQIKALGYGIVHTYAYTTIAYNLFNYNRHSIAGSGVPNSGYVAHNNVEFGESLSTYFDMHGGYDRNKNYDEEIAGEYVEIYNNTFLG